MTDDRYILVIADGSKEMEIALQYACARSKKTNRKINIATFIEPIDVLTTQGVTEIMQNEAREEAEKKLKKASKIVKESTGMTPVLHIREGEIIKELIVKLYDWTDQRWIINVSSKKGEDTILEKQNNIQNNIVDEVSNKEEIKKVMEAFPDSKITSISKVDNRNESK